MPRIFRGVQVADWMDDIQAAAYVDAIRRARGLPPLEPEPNPAELQPIVEIEPAADPQVVAARAEWPADWRPYDPVRIRSLADVLRPRNANAEWEGLAEEDLAEPEGEEEQEVRISRDLLQRYPVIAFDQPLGKVFNKKGYQSSKGEMVVGIEIEQETKTEFILPDVEGWTQHREGSLRDFGFEFVLYPPLEVNKALKKTNELYKELPVKRLSSSLRTSTHVHIDVTKYTFSDLVTFACVYWMCEPVLLKFAGPDRKGNLFCLQAKDSNFLQKYVAQALSEATPYHSRLYNENYRYASLNFASVPKFGSIETRLMRGVSDPKEIAIWLAALQKIKEHALKFKNPHEFLSMFFSKEYKAESFYEDVFGKDGLEQLLSLSKDNGNLVHDLRQIASGLFVVLHAREKYDLSQEKKAAEEEYKQEKEREKQRVAAMRLRNPLLSNVQRIRVRAPEEDYLENAVVNPELVYAGAEEL